jgi:glycosyltransferase involved in cell wall biosynthesis
MGAKLILDMHEITPEFYMSKYGIHEDAFLIRLLKFVEKVSVDFADYVVTIHEPILDLLVARGLSRSKALVVMNAVDEARFSAGPDAATADGGGEPRFVMMYHGTLTKIYGLDIAIEAFEMVHKQMPGAELWILGSGTEQATLASMAEEGKLTSKVRLVGQVKSSEIPGWLAKCTVGILPIRRDVFLEYAFPNKLPEFIVAGKPVLISRLRTIRHYFSEEAVAFFEPNNPAALSEQMLRLFGDRALHARLTTVARREYAPLRWDLMKQRYLKLIDDLAGSMVSPVKPTAAASDVAR